MEMNERIVVVTGGCSGIGAALAQACLAAGARAVVVADLHEEGAPAGAQYRRCDVGSTEDIPALVREVEREHGRIDVFCSNAGVLTPGWDLREADFARWERDWRINVQAHAVAAKAVLPGMIARGEGYLLNTASAAGLLASPESAVYTATKHAALGLAEFLAFSYRRFGIRVSALCPMAVHTRMLTDHDDGSGSGGSAGLDGVMRAEDVAAAVIEGMREERFLILPHPNVATYYARKAAQHDKWLQAMAALQQQFTDAGRSAG